MITDRTLETTAFTLNYPSGWRVVTGEAQLSPKVTLVAPDEISTITVMVGNLSEGALGSAGMRSDMRQVMLDDGTPITLLGQAPVERWETFLPILEAVVESVR